MKDDLLREAREILLAVAPLLGRLSKEQPRLSVNPDLSARASALAARIKKALPKPPLDGEPDARHDGDE